MYKKQGIGIGYLTRPPNEVGHDSVRHLEFSVLCCGIHSQKLTWKPKKGPIKTTVPLKGAYMGFHVSLGECRWSARTNSLGGDEPASDKEKAKEKEDGPETASQMQNVGSGFRV